MTTTKKLLRQRCAVLLQTQDSTAAVRCAGANKKQQEHTGHVKEEKHFINASSVIRGRIQHDFKQLAA